MKQIFTFICAALIVTACDLEKEIDIEGAEFHESINISGHISRKYGASVYVERTLPSQSLVSYHKKIEDAKVYLTSGGEKIAEIPSYGFYDDSLLYHIDIDTFSYNSYGILVESKSLGTAYSKEQILPDEAVADSVAVTKTEGEALLATFYFANDKNQVGYYCNAYSADRITDWSKLFLINFDDHDAMKFQDARKEKHCQISCIFYPSSSYYDEVEYYADFITLSPDLAKYLKSVEEYYASQEDEFFDYPYPLYCNIKGGYGFFGAYTVSQTSGVVKGKWVYFE